MGLERREIVVDPLHGRPHLAGPFHLDVQERDSQGELGRRQQLLADPRQDLLRRQPVDEPLAKRVEEIRLLDVFLALEHGHREDSSLFERRKDVSLGSAGALFARLRRPRASRGRGASRALGRAACRGRGSGRSRRRLSDLVGVEVTRPEFWAHRDQSLQALSFPWKNRGIGDPVFATSSGTGNVG